MWLVNKAEIYLQKKVLWNPNLIAQGVYTPLCYSLFVGYHQQGKGNYPSGLLMSVNLFFKIKFRGTPKNLVSLP